MSRILGALLVLAVIAALWFRGDAADSRARADREQATAQQAVDALAAANRKIEQERATAAALQTAADSATEREAKIDEDYQERISAAIAGRDSQLGRLRKEWAACEVRVSDSAAAIAEAAEADRLRQARAARIVRAVELAQSERDETIDRYEAVRLGRLP